MPAITVNEAGALRQAPRRPIEDVLLVALWPRRARACPGRAGPHLAGHHCSRRPARRPFRARRCCRSLRAPQVVPSLRSSLLSPQHGRLAATAILPALCPPAI